MRSFSKKLAFVLAAAMVFTSFAPAASAKAADEMAINKTSKILYVTDGTGMNDAAQVGGGKGNVSSYDFSVKNKPADWKTTLDFKWTSNDKEVATVKAGGLVTAVGVGKATISCTITDKATGKEVTTVKTKVTVKANAADVELKANDYDGATVVAGDVVNLDRVMYDADGNKTTKRGEYVTDYTRWIAEPATGVEINPKNGEFTFTADAVAGDYTLYCETYQSSKYTGTTATSDKVVVTFVADNELDNIAQKSATKFTIEFANPVSALAVADVKVTRLLTVGSQNYEYPEQVKAVTLAKDGMTADVEIFGKFADKANYVIEVTGFDAYEKTMTLGYPTYMTITAKDAEIPYVLTVDVATELVATFYNDDNVDVTTGDENVIYRLETRSTDGSYYLSGKKLTIKKENVYPVVIAEYQGRIENGKRVGNFSATQEFTAFKQAPIVISGINRYTVDTTKMNDWDADVTTIRKSDNTKQLNVQILKSNGDKIWATNGSLIDSNAYKVTFDAMNPEIAVVDGAGYLKAFKTGTAYFYVNVAAKKANSTAYDTATPIAIVAVTVEADAAFSYMTLDNAAITIGTAAGFNTGSVKLTSFDTYNQKFDFAADKAITVECNTDGFEKNAFASAITIAKNGAEATISFNATTLKSVLATKELAPAAGDAAVVYFTVKYNDKALDLVVTIQEPSDSTSDYIVIEADKTYVDAVRYATPNDNNSNTENAKTVTFKVFKYNNGVKVAELDFSAYPANGEASAVSEGAYVYKVVRNGEAYAATQTGNAVKINLSTTKGVSNSAINAAVVDYTNMGAGTYEFQLYTCYGDEEKVLVQEYSSIVDVVVGDAGSYSLVGDILDNEVEVSATYNAADAAEILKCFTIKDKDGAEVVDRKNTANLADDVVKENYTYFVNYEAPAGTGYVYVKDITFYEAVGSEYVAYTVTIDTVLNNK